MLTEVLDFLAESEPNADHDWLIPGVLERGERAIVTGAEGAGKSTLLRQIAVQVAAGIHPFSLDEIPQASVLLVDLENERRHVRRQLRPLVAAAEAAGRGVQEESLYVSVCEGLDLLQQDSAAELVEDVECFEADLLVLGPLYKLTDEDTSAEEIARRVTARLDEVRHLGCSLLLEGHQPHAINGNRPRRPFGSSIWMRWPEFGLSLERDGRLTPWRGPRDERAWPARFERGGPWPWTAVEETEAVEAGHDIDQVREAVQDAVREHLASGESSSARACRDAVRNQGIRARNQIIDDARRALLPEGIE